MHSLLLLLLLLWSTGSHGLPVATSEKTQEQDLKTVQVNAEF